MKKIVSAMALAIGHRFRDLEWWLNVPYRGLLSKWLPGLFDSYSVGFFATSLLVLVTLIFLPMFVAGWGSPGTFRFLIFVFFVTWFGFAVIQLNLNRFIRFQQVVLIATAVALLVLSRESSGLLDYSAHLFLFVILIFAAVALAASLI